MSMLDKVNSAIEIKGDIADAIEAKGVSMTGVTFGGYATKIGEISTGGAENVASRYINCTALGTVTSGCAVTKINVPWGGSFSYPQGVTAYGCRTDSYSTVTFNGDAIGCFGNGHITTTFNGKAYFIYGFKGTATFNDEASYLQPDGNCTFNSDVEYVCFTGGNSQTVTINASTVWHFGLGTGNTMSLQGASLAKYGVIKDSAVLDVGNNATATIYAESGATITGGGTITHLVDTTDTDATASNVLDGKTFFSANNRFASTGTMPTSTVTETSAQAVITSGYLANGVTITKGGGMPSIPSSFTTLSLNTSYTASGDGWIKYKISYQWGAGWSAVLTIGSRTYQITASGEDQDMGWIEMEGIAPVYSGETFEMTTQGAASNHAYLKVAYL